VTPAQLAAARAVREELRLMFERARELTLCEEVLAIECKLSGIPPVNGSLCGALSRALMECAEAMDAYDEFLAAYPEAAGESAGIRSGAGAAHPFKAAA
jgi:hypothetical protein